MHTVDIMLKPSIKTKVITTIYSMASDLPIHAKLDYWSQTNDLQCKLESYDNVKHIDLTLRRHSTRYWIRGQVHKCFTSFLTKRKMRETIIDRECSTYVTVDWSTSRKIWSYRIPKGSPISKLFQFITQTGIAFQLTDFGIPYYLSSTQTFYQMQLNWWGPRCSSF